MSVRAVLVAAVIAVVVGVTGPMAGSASASGTIDGAAVLGQTGKKALVQGWLPKCRAGVRTVTVRLIQSGKVAKGSWKGRCRGAGQGWSAVVRTGGARFSSGSARVRVQVRRKFGKQRSAREVARRVRLRTKAGELPADRQIMVGVTFEVPAGAKVEVQGGGAEQHRSVCTRDETVESFTSDGNRKRILFQFTAKNGGSCDLAPSYNNVWVNVDGPGEADQHGFFWLGQKGPGFGYFADCRAGIDDAALESWVFENKWQGLKCSKQSDWELNVWLP